ncbi:Exostosin-like protein [Dioscorea alata]|uniref:Exostosin-like protein n=1 Tax=Dioscorea alata TaxID=55571 RepID=A0ACB7WDL6_DIOAL|nr:Exostosin-like protein [Dioscorea alata]
MALSPPRERKHSKLIPLLSIFFSLWIILLLLSFPSPSSPPPPPTSQCPQDMPKFYIYNLPSNFNDHLLHHCDSLNIYTNMCPYVSNEGLGRQLSGKSSSWFVTHQFLAEMVFHARALRHPCRTLDPTSANLFHVPFYAGLYASSHFRTANLTLRDELAVTFSDYLTRQPHWHRHHGRDHFIVIGRTAWDFMRNDDSTADFGANRLLLLPEIKNMTVLTVERQPWAGRNQYGIPYPSYFHPRNRSELTSWQELVRKSNRTHLFSFVGGSRPASNQMAAVRGEILKQCNASAQCLQVECEAGSSRCYEPDRVLNVMMKAEFCLQPPGDSFTRRSVFDSILAGCVPVFFSEHTAYTQYKWYMPNRTQDWSVFLGSDQWIRIEEELGKIPKIQIQQMRIQIIDLIPSMTYAHPDVVHGDEVGFRDAVDVALVELNRLVWSGRKPV